MREYKSLNVKEKYLLLQSARRNGKSRPPLHVTNPPTSLLLTTTSAHDERWCSSCISGALHLPCRRLTRNVWLLWRICPSSCPRTRGCWFQAVIPQCRRRVCPCPVSLDGRNRRLTRLIADELPAVKNGSVWVSRFRNIVDYLRQYSEGSWDLDEGAGDREKADIIACVHALRSPPLEYQTNDE